MGRKNSKKTKHKEKQHSSHAKALKGVMDITRSGMGFVKIEGMDADIIVRPSDFNTAMHGDTVRIAIKEMKSSGRRMQGVVKRSIAT